MAQIPGGLRITGFISPTDSSDEYATHDAIYGRGGLRSVATTTARDAITDDRRAEGMMVYVEADGKVYILSGGTANTNWQEFSGSGSGSVGATGATGLQGSTGATGLQGSTGATGPSGLPGDVGPTGATGPAGADSIIPGATGATGLQGATGPAGTLGSITEGKIIIGDATYGSIESPYTIPKTLTKEGPNGATGALENDVLALDSSGNLKFYDVVSALAEMIAEEISSSNGYTTITPDLNGDGTVGTEDLLILLSLFGNSEGDTSSLSIVYTFNPNVVNLSNSVGGYNSQTSTSSLTKIEVPASPVYANAPAPLIWDQSSIADYIVLYYSNGIQASLGQRQRNLIVTYDGEVSCETTGTINFGFYINIIRQYPTDPDETELLFVDSKQIVISDAQYSVDMSLVKTIPFTSNPFAIASSGGNSEYPTGVKMYPYVCASWPSGNVEIDLSVVKFQYTTNI